MVLLLVDNLNQTTLLEQALRNANIEYAIKLDDGRFGLKPPYTIINGAPLDELRTLKWIGDK